MICRHFPPAVSGGARRPYLLAQAFRRFGHEVTVVAPTMTECPGVRVIAIHHPLAEPSAAAPAGEPSKRRFRDFVRANLMLPDPDIRWNLRVVWRLRGHPRPDWVLTTSPPESAHVAGWLLKKIWRCRWIADFRDSWLAFPMRSQLRRRGGRYHVETLLARLLLPATDAVVATVTEVQEEVVALGARGKRGIVGIFSDPPPPPIQLPQDTVNLVHTGSFSLSDPDRSIEPLLEAIRAAGREDVRLYLIGRLSAAELAAIRALPRPEQVIAMGVLPREEAMSFQAGADALLLIAAAETPHIPGKLGEYLATGKPILAFGGGAWVEAYGLPRANTMTELVLLIRSLQKNASPAASRLDAVSLDQSAAEFVKLMS